MTHLPIPLVQVYEKLLINHGWPQDTNEIWINMKTDADWFFLINMFGEIFQMASGSWCGEYFYQRNFVRKVTTFAVVICKDTYAGIAQICLRHSDLFKPTKVGYSNIYQFAKEWMQITSGSLNPIFKI